MIRKPIIYALMVIGVVLGSGWLLREEPPPTVTIDPGHPEHARHVFQRPLEHKVGFSMLMMPLAIDFPS